MKFSLHALFCIFCLTVVLQSPAGIGDALHDAVSGAAKIAGEAVVTTGDIVHDVLDPRYSERRVVEVDDAMVDDFMQKRALQQQNRPVARVTKVTRTTEYLD